LRANWTHPSWDLEVLTQTGALDLLWSVFNPQPYLHPAMAKNQSSEVEGSRIPSSEHGLAAGDVRSGVPAAAPTY